MITDWRRVRDNFNHQTVLAIVRDLYRGDPGSTRLISKDYNIVYRFQAVDAGFYLRICHSVLHPLPEARQVMRFLRFLADERVPVGAPIPSVNGQYIELLAGGYFVSAQSEAPGQEMTHHMLDVTVYQAWGQSLGKLHAASRRYQPDPANDYNSPSVQRFWRNIESTIRSTAPEIQHIYAELTDWMRSLPTHDYGLIHGDYRPAMSSGTARPPAPSTSTNRIIIGTSPMSHAPFSNSSTGPSANAVASVTPSCAATSASITSTTSG